MANFKKLEVWEKAHALSLFSHKVAVEIKGALYSSLKNQMVRAAASIPTNIVEGREQKTDAEFARTYVMRLLLHQNSSTTRSLATTSA